MMLVAPVAVTLRRLQGGVIITEGAFKIVAVRLGLVNKTRTFSLVWTAS